jgi:hypothetical protein
VRRIVYTGTFPDGSQLMISRYVDDDGAEVLEAATRPVADRAVVWSPPIDLEPEAQWENGS